MVERAAAGSLCRGEFDAVINGIDPGFSGDTLVSRPESGGACHRHHRQEIFDYGSYDDAEFTGASFGFGEPADHRPVMSLPGVLASMWGARFAPWPTTWA